MKKKILSVILAVTMIVTALPFNAFALSYGTSSELADRTIGINMFNFSERADNYVSSGATSPTNAQRLEEIEDVLAAGYINQIFLPMNDNFEATVALCEKYDCNFWISPGYYVSSNQTLSNYVANVELRVNRVRAAGAYDRMLGFYWDEPLWAHSMTNADLLAMTKALYEKWGKRNYVVFAVGSFIDGYDTTTEQVTKASSKYVTDAGWDNYGYDVRDSALSSSSQKSAIKSYNDKYGTNHANAKELYRWMHNELMEKFDHDVYTWFFPIGHVGSTWTGTADESYATAHLNFFKDLLYEQKKPGGLSLYTYTTFSTPGLEQLLPIKNLTTGTQKLYPSVAKWNTYAARLKAVKTEFDSKKLSTLDDMPFGSLDVANVTYDTITINANNGYQYSVNDGASWNTTGKFTGLSASTDYTVTVKRTSDGKTKTFAVSTTAPYPYSTGYDDTASYIMRMPTELNYYSPTYGWISTGISRNKEDTDFKKDSSGNYTSDGYIHLKTIDGERFLEVKNNNMEANSNVYLSFGDQNRATTYKGFPKNLETQKLSAFAFRIKTTGGSAGQLSIFDLFINGRRTSRAVNNSLLYLDKTTLEVSELTYSNGINITDNIDGWVIIPFDAYDDFDSDSATTNREWLENNLTNIQIWQHKTSCEHSVASSSWVNRTWYVGDVMCLEDAESFVMARQGVTDLPDGTLGYVMDVPETEQFINWKDSSTDALRFSQWHTRFLMNQSAANEADPFNATSYPSSGGGLYVKNIDGETYMVWNPNDVMVTTEYTDGTNTPVANYGTYNEHNCTIFWNNISVIENSRFGLNDTGLSAIPDYFESNITHLAFRIKVVGGHEGQQSVFHLLDPSESKIWFGYTTAYFLDINTGETFANKTADTVIVLPEGDFDGYMIIPVPAEALAKLQASTGLRIHTFTSNSTYHKESDWRGRSVCFGDVYAVDDEIAFGAQFAPSDGKIDGDTSTNLMTVPDEGGFISYNDSSSYGGGKDWGLRRWNTSEVMSTFPDGTNKYAFACMSSVTENGENFFKTYVNTTANFATTGVREFPVIFIPAVYEKNIAWDNSEANFADLHSDAADYNYVAIRFKTTGTSASGVSKVGFHIGSGNAAMTITGAKSYNLATGKTETVTGGTVMTVPDNFDGWFIIPYSSLETAYYVGLILYQNSVTDNWDDKTIYFGDIKMIKNTAAFLAVNGAPEFTVAPAANNKLVITNTVDTDKAALYTVDGENWYDIDAFNALTLEGNKYYTVTARYPWGVTSAVISKTVFNAYDTATPLMPVDKDVIYYTNWDYNDGAYGLGFTSGETTPNSTNTGWNTSDGSSAHIFSTYLDGERYWEIVDNPEQTNCRQFNILPLYSLTDTIGTKFENAADFNYLAIRLRFEEDATGTAPEGATHPISINLQGLNTSDGTFGQWAYKDVYFYDIKTGETVAPDVQKYDLPLGFDGYVIFPSDAVYCTDHFGTLSDMYRVNVFMHDADGSHDAAATADWTGTTLYIGDMELVEDVEAFMDVRTNCEFTGKHVIASVAATAPSEDSNGCVAHYACINCGETYADANGTQKFNPELLRIESASLTLEQNIAINFKANVANLEGFENVYAKFTYADGKVKTVKMGTAVGGKNVFTFDNIGPQSLGQVVTAQLFGTYNGIEYAGKAISYSVKDYCYNKLNQYAGNDDKNVFKTMLVDLLNYGAKAQIYTETDTNDLVNADLSYNDSKLATLTPPTVSNGIKGVYNEIDETVVWNGVNLHFEANVGLKFRFTAENTSGLTVKVMDAKSGGNVLAEIKSFSAVEDGSSVAYFDGLDATQMRKTVYAAVYNGDTQVSEIIAYSVLAYAGQKVAVTASSATTEQKNLASLVSHMMRYGDSAAAYVNANS